jgi:hypothetical protein
VKVNIALTLEELFENIFVKMYLRFCIFSHEKENYYFEQILKKTGIRVREKKLLKKFP